jgi:hypothetical protein
MLSGVEKEILLIRSNPQLNDQNFTVLFFVSIIILAALLIAFSERIRRRGVRPQPNTPRMRELTVPSDESQKLVFFSLLGQEGIEFHEAPFHSGPFAFTQLSSSFVLVSDEDYDRAVQILEDFENKA